ncbi:MAG: hypothetical protein ACQEP1_05080 [Nanobdellota archaeon]
MEKGHSLGIKRLDIYTPNSRTPASLEEQGPLINGAYIENLGDSIVKVTLDYPEKIREDYGNVAFTHLWKGTLVDNLGRDDLSPEILKSINELYRNLDDLIQPVKEIFEEIDDNYRIFSSIDRMIAENTSAYNIIIGNDDGSYKFFDVLKNNGYSAFEKLSSLKSIDDSFLNKKGEYMKNLEIGRDRTFVNDWEPDVYVKGTTPTEAAENALNIYENQDRF